MFHHPSCIQENVETGSPLLGENTKTTTSLAARQLRVQTAGWNCARAAASSRCRLSLPPSGGCWYGSRKPTQNKRTENAKSQWDGCQLKRGRTDGSLQGEPLSRLLTLWMCPVGGAGLLERFKAAVCDVPPAVPQTEAFLSLHSSPSVHFVIIFTLPSSSTWLFVVNFRGMFFHFRCYF